MAVFEEKVYGYPYPKSLILAVFEEKVYGYPCPKSLILALFEENHKVILSEMIDFEQILKKNHRSTSIRNDWFYADFEDKNMFATYRNLRKSIKLVVLTNTCLTN